MYHGLARFWSRVALRFGVRVRVHGPEHLEPARSYIYVSNHASMFDIPVVAAGIPDDIRLVYKRSSKRSRSSAGGCDGAATSGSTGEEREARRSLDEAVEQIRDGVSVLMFAEGTRTSTESYSRSSGGRFIWPCARACRSFP